MKKKRDFEEEMKSILIFDEAPEVIVIAQLSHNISQEDLCFSLDRDPKEYFFKDAVSFVKLKDNEEIQKHVIMCKRTVKERLIHLLYKERSYSFNLTNQCIDSSPYVHVLKHAQMVFQSKDTKMVLEKPSEEIDPERRLEGRCYPGDTWRLLQTQALPASD